MALSQFSSLEAGWAGAEVAGVKPAWEATEERPRGAQPVHQANLYRAESPPVLAVCLRLYLESIYLLILLLLVKEDWVF